MNFKVVPIDDFHVNRAVDIHLMAFPDFFLSFLGPRFLHEFYASFLYDSQGIGYVAVAPGGRTLGVVVGPLDPSGYFSRLLKNRWWAFCLASFEAVIKRPSCIPRLLRALFYRGESPSGPTRALLSSVAVDPALQGVGVGQALVRRWIEETARKGATGCFLTTDAVGNDRINSFYQGLGWVVESTFETPEGRRMNRYVYDF